MARINDYSIMDFSGGLIRDKSDYLMDKNELKNTLNLELEERGRAIRRRGYRRFSTQGGSGDIDAFYAFTRETLGSRPTSYLFFVDRSNDATIYSVITSSLNSAITTTTTSISLTNNAAFSASGTIEIEGDIIAYGSGGGTTTLASVTGINQSHPAGTSIRQTQTSRASGGTAIDTRLGCYFAVLNNVLILNATANGSWTWDGSSWTDISDVDEQTGLFVTNYRDRIYTAGSGDVTTAFQKNGNRNRIAFSSAGDATVWTSTDFFDAEDQRGEEISGLRVHKDRLFIFKPNSTFVYDEVQLRITLLDIGAYNHRVIQDIGDAMYIFCPSGVFITNGFTAKRISDPVSQYIKNFVPQYDSSSDRVIFGTFSWVYDKKYYLYIGDITDPETLTDVVLVYDTIRKNWTVFNGFVNFTNAITLNKFLDAAGGSTSNQNNLQNRETVIGMTPSGKVHMLFDGKTRDESDVVAGGDIIPDNLDNTGIGISTVLETPLLDIGNPSWVKDIGYARILVERGRWSVSYRIDMGDSITDWMPLGEFGPTNSRVRLKQRRGYRYAFKVTSNQLDYIGIFNGIILEEIDAVSRKDING